jgi:hypothetical protein
MSMGHALLAAEAANAATNAPTIDLADPTATVRDPVAALAPVNTECAPGQADLNTASVSELSAALNLPSDPTVKRLVALRPWLKGADLSSVPGIGPEAAAALAPKTCATQIVLPAASPLACTSMSQVDLQAASAAVIASKLKLPAVQRTRSWRHGRCRRISHRSSRRGSTGSISPPSRGCSTTSRSA